MSTYTTDLQTLSIGLLLARIVVGLLMTAHGAQKLFGWFGGPGLHAAGQFMGQLGFHPGRVFATAASIGEITAGLLVAFGFLGPVGPALMISVMIVAAVTVHWGNGLFATTNGIELPLLYSTAAFGLAMTGFGQYSLDAWLGIARVWSAPVTGIALTAGAIGGLTNLALRHRPTSAART